MPRQCNRCVHKTKSGRLCKRRTCKTSNLPYCWQHLPAAAKGKSLQTRLNHSLEDGSKAGRSEVYDHMIRVYGGSPQEVEIISYQLNEVFKRRSKWVMKIWRDPKTKVVVAHVIAYPANPVSRLARAEFDGKQRALRPHVSARTLYIDSVGTEAAYRRRGMASVLLRSFGRPLLLHAEDAGAIRAYRRIGFKRIDELSSPARTCMKM
jgi:ribosomal protein S18 acetylase RimI-like enzyme